MMNHGRSVSLKKVVLLAAGTAVGVFQLCGWLGLRFNPSPSLPLGIYITTDRPDVTLVEFCPAQPFARLAAERGYREKGTCPDGAAPLLKPVAAKPGDIVDLSPRGIAVNGKLLPNTAPLRRDTKGRPLVPWNFGRRMVEPGTIWAASTYNRRSYDSRYFGPVNVASIRAQVRPLLTLW